MFFLIGTDEAQQHPPIEVVAKLIDETATKEGHTNGESKVSSMTTDHHNNLSRLSVHYSVLNQPKISKNSVM